MDDQPVTWPEDDDEMQRLAALAAMLVSDRLSDPPVTVADLVAAHAELEAAITAVRQGEATWAALRPLINGLSDLDSRADREVQHEAARLIAEAKESGEEAELTTRPPKGTPEYDLWIAAIEVASDPPLKQSKNAQCASVYWPKMHALRAALEALDIDWRTVYAKTHA